MTQIVYVSDNSKQSTYFINDLFSDLQKLNISSIKFIQQNAIIVGDTEVRGISIYENCLCLKINRAKYFIDGIDMRNYKDADKRKLDMLTWRVEEVIMHTDINAKQLSGKEELIKTLTENLKFRKNERLKND